LGSRERRRATARQAPLTSSNPNASTRSFARSFLAGYSAAGPLSPISLAILNPHTPSATCEPQSPDSARESANYL